MSVAELGYKIDSSGAVVAAGDLDKMTAAAIKAERGAGKLGNAAQVAGKKGFFAGSGFRNMALQLNQVGQQTAASGDLLRSFTIQLPDLLLGFGTLGIAAGALAPLMVGFATSLVGASGDARDFEATIDDVSDAIERYRAATDLATSGTSKLIEEFGLSSPALAQALSDLAAVDKIDALDNINSAVDRLSESVLNYSYSLGAIGDAGDLLGIETQLQGNITSWKNNRAAVSEFNDELRAMAAASSLDEQYEAAIRVRDQFKEIVDVNGEMTDRQKDFLRSLSRTIVEMEAMRGAVLDASDATDGWADAMAGVRVELSAIGAIIASLGGGAISNAAKNTEIAALRAGNSIKDAARAASEFKQNLEIDAQVAGLESKFGKVGTVMGAVIRGQAEYTQELDRTLDAERDIAIEREREAAKAARAGGGGGGRSRGGRGRSGASRDTYQRDIDALVESLRTERETVDAWYAESDALLNDRRTMELLGVEGHNEAKLRLEQEYQERLSGIRGGYHGSALDQAQTFAGDMANALASGNDKMQAAAQAFASVEALINAYRAYNQVMADPSLPWYAKIPAAAGVLAAGMKTVQSIKSLSGSGGGSGGGSSASAPSAGGGASTSSPQQVIVQLSGTMSSVVAPMMDEIVKGIQKRSDEGEYIIAGFTTA